MEVESWVSVQARRERFEQLYEDSPLAFPQKTAPSHLRPRTSSISNNDSQSSESVRTLKGRQIQLKNLEQDRDQSKYTPFTESCLRSSTPPTSIKHSKSNLQEEEVDHPYKRDEGTSESGATPKFSSARRIPVFKSANTLTDGKKIEVTEVPVSEGHGKRGRFFSHIRSRSHGNFVTKRDSSVEKDSSIGERNGGVVHKEKFHKDWLTPKRKQRSIDNLLSNEDFKSNSSFEGKQKIVSHIVKNMKNKEKPTVLRKLSFTSKNEKDLKNMKDKSAAQTSKQKQPKTLLSSAEKKITPSNLHKQKSCSKDSGINMEHKIVEDKVRQTKSQVTEAAIAPISIAKAVADAALRRSSAVTADGTSTASSQFTEDKLSVPPARPPRRRAAGPEPTPRRKGKAPSPPNHSSSSPLEPSFRVQNDTSFKISSSDESAYFSSTSPDLRNEYINSPQITSHRFRGSPEDHESYESISPHSIGKSHDNTPEMTHISSTPVSRFLKINANEVCASPYDERGKEQNYISKTEMQSKKEEKSNAHVTENNLVKEDNLEKTVNDMEILPAGPPPKKPPRTFAYDIYRNINTSKCEVDSVDSDMKTKNETKSSQPIYAVPVKKKNKIIPKPPIRSKSDLSREITKPSVAPKPPHVLAKAKRASLVDPLSNLEKDEEAAITSEFQRQAHIRYSLRKPNKQLPTPSPHCTEHSSNETKSNFNLLNSSSGSEDDPNYSTVKKKHISSKGATPFTEKEDSTDTSIVKIRSVCKSGQNMYESEYDEVTLTSPGRPPSCPSHMMPSPSALTDSEQPLSLTHTPPPDTAHLQARRSMSDETLYRGSRQSEEPVYATPIFKTNLQSLDQSNQKELHYMCSVLFTDEEEADAGRDRGEGRLRSNSVLGREKILGTDAEDGNKGRSSLISAWKREFRQSCRQVQSRIKRTVIR